MAGETAHFGLRKREPTSATQSCLALPRFKAMVDRAHAGLAEPFRGIAVRVTPEQAIQQVDIETNSMVPSKGFVGGALVTALTATGTNGLHGSLFEFNSGNWSRTRYFYNNVPGNPNPRFTYNQFGATVGGPIYRDKTFYFASYEGTYQNGGMTQLSTVPVPGVVTGNFSGIPGLTLFNPFTGSSTGVGRTPISGNVIRSEERRVGKEC